MPRKSKEELKTNSDVVEIKEISNQLSNVEPAGNKSSTSKSTKSKPSSSKSTSTKVTKKSLDTNKKASKTTSSKTAEKEAKPDSDEVTKKTTAKKSASTKTTAKKTKADSDEVTKKTTAKKSASTKTTAKKTKADSDEVAKKTTSKKSTTKSAVVNVEYYDLPYRYNETVVKILAQTPTMLFIYWDVADSDRNSYIEKYGDDFFNNTKPVLIVRNKTKNYTFEIEINDFANSWYLHVNDADCDYSVELGRRPIYYDSNMDNYIYITTSNDMETPNNRILFDKLGKSVFFRNVKNNFIQEIELSSISFIKNIGKVYDIYELYAEMYKDEIDEESDSTLKLDLSSSNSSTFK